MLRKNKMEAKRKVDFRILFNLLKSRGPISIIGMVFTALTVLVFIPLIVILSFTLKEPYQAYSFDAIGKKGVEKNATITNVKLLTNVSYNGQNPSVITYTYDDNGIKTTDKFQTLESEKAALLHVGSEMPVLIYNGQSIIKDLEPFSFPFEMFYLFPAVFGTVGALFLLFSLTPALKIYRLYKTGEVKDAYIISIEANGGLSLNRSVRSYMTVNYFFLDDFKNETFGNSPTNDLLFLNGKKEGDKIKIFVSDKDQSSSCLIPNLEAKKYNWSI